MSCPVALMTDHLTRSVLLYSSGSRAVSTWMKSQNIQLVEDKCGITLY